MNSLIIVSFIWAFSFGLIKKYLTGVDPNAVVFWRLGISLAVFLPFLKIRKIRPGVAVRLAAIGALQYGLMYLAYLRAFQYLKAYEVALFTILTPLYVTLAHDAFTERRIRPIPFFGALLAVLGAGIITWNSPEIGALGLGFLYVQISNLAFALGQIFYRDIFKRLEGVRDHEVFALLYLGGTLLAGALFYATPRASHAELSGDQFLTIVYLGVVASGLAFYLWNFGTRRVSAGVLAVFNNLKIPLAVICSLVFFGEHTHIPKLIVGSVVMLIAFYWVEKNLGRQKGLDPQ